MHEFALAERLVATAVAIHKEDDHPVDVITLRLGARAGVTPAGLLYAYDIAKHGTPLANSHLAIEYLPVIVHCPVCQREQTVADPYILICPVCQTPTGDVVQGKEFELVTAG